MNLIKKTGIAALILGAATIANAQIKETATNSMTFEATVLSISDISVTDAGLKNAAFFKSAGGADNAVLAGTIDVKTNMPTWDVVVVPKNKGILKGASKNLQVYDAVGKKVADAVLELYACHGPGKAPAPATVCKPASSASKIGLAATASALGTLNTTAGNPNAVSVSIAGKNIPGFGATDTDAQSEAYFGIYALIKGAFTDISSASDTYKEELSFVLCSKY